MTTIAQDLGFGEAEQEIKRAAAQVLAARAPAHVVHGMVAGPGVVTSQWDRALWAEMVELGWPALAVPEQQGGFGVALVGAVGLIEEVGRFAVPSPLPATLCATYLLRACANAAAEELLAQIAQGTKVALAVCDATGDWENVGVEVRDGRLHGRAYFVQDAQKADVFVVRASDGFYQVQANAVAQLLPDRIVDLTRDQAQLVFEHTPAIRLGALQAWERAWPAILLVLAADMVGAAEWQLQTTAEYARTRVQFERTLGFFQAVKHPLVNMMLAIDRAKTLLYEAACLWDEDRQDASMVARMAKVAASDAAGLCSDRSVQLHGGVGFTWECFVQIYFKRQQHTLGLYGDGTYQRAKLAEQIFLPL